MERLKICVLKKVAQQVTLFFKHGVIGKGLNDYDAIFTTLKGVGFSGWVSIEDGVDGMEQMIESANFLKRKINEIWA